jgi:HSP20 family molecular chaperone IbpA
MHEQLVIQRQNDAIPIRSRVLSYDEFVAAEREVADLIAQRAYELYESRDRLEGNDLADWLHAKSELTPEEFTEIVEFADRIIVQTQVHGFRAHELRIEIEGRHILISGKRIEASDDDMELSSDQNNLRIARVFHIIHLPAAVQPAETATIFKNGVLSFRLRKARRVEKPPYTSH